MFSAQTLAGILTLCPSDAVHPGIGESAHPNLDRVMRPYPSDTLYLGVTQNTYPKSG